MNEYYLEPWKFPQNGFGYRNLISLSFDAFLKQIFIVSIIQVYVEVLLYNNCSLSNVIIYQPESQRTTMNDLLNILLEQWVYKNR